ncbi:calcium-binding protein [Pseudoduganella chitinolytica]|uniref:Calcium-binding protein n=1 Tax=Pseudoduganella chitinolytica TaxID=34070 RepID=A0ABY8BG84_9BURK|nr:calcium-binding protein [Pseudoduganella chitinolytica]WEF34935.1 calcium-binding protein [Pseudoduganella chitinolytica]
MAYHVKPAPGPAHGPLGAPRKMGGAATSGEAGTLVLADAGSGSVALARAGDDLVIRYGSDEQVTVAGQFAGGGVGRIEFSGAIGVDTTDLATQLALQGTAGDDQLLGVAAGWSAHDRIHGYDGADYLRDADGGANLLDGGAGNDTIHYAADGENTIMGGAGDDTIVSLDGAGSGHASNVAGDGGDDCLVGGAGAETYAFRRGDGNDTLLGDTGAAGDPGAVDRFLFGAGIAPADVTFTQDATMLVLRIRDPDDPAALQSVRLFEWFGTAGSRYIEWFEFADGARIDAAQASAAATRMVGGADADLLRGYAETTLVDAGDGNDTIVANSEGAVVVRGGGGNDDISYVPRAATCVEGGSGDDTIVGQGPANEFEHTIAGGAGNDSLQGSEGREVYLFERGDGRDVLRDTGPAAQADRIVLGAGIVRSDVSVVRESDDLVLRIGGDGATADSIRVQQWFYGAERRIESVQFADGTALTAAQLSTLANTLVGTAGNDTLTGYHGTPSIDGLAGDDTITGGTTAALLRGGSGNDRVLYVASANNTIEGGSGDDYLAWTYNASSAASNVLVGGTGNDTLVGSDSFDTYHYNRGDGSDVIGDFGVAWATDRLAFGAGIARADLADSRVGQDLVLLVRDAANPEAVDRIRVRDWFAGDSYRIERLEFAGGTALSGSQLAALGATLRGTEANDTLNGYAETRAIDGGGGNDTIAGGTAVAALQGGAGHDMIRFAAEANAVVDGGSGNDTLIGSASTAATGTTRIAGGTGDDSITGTWGATTYLFNRGDGRDVITDNGDTASTDRLVFGAGIGQGELALRRSANDLVLTIGAGSADAANPAPGDRIAITGWFATAGRVIERIEFADGSFLTAAQVAGMTFGTAAADTLAAQDQHLLVGLGGDDRLTAGNRAALLDGGAGNDTLVGGAAADFLYGGQGNDSVTAGGSDVVGFNGGDGADTLLASGGNVTLALGGDSDPAQFQLAQAGSALLLALGGGDSVTLQDWYGGTPAHGVARLQVLDAQAGVAALYDFRALVAAFDDARAADGAIGWWDAGAGLSAVALAGTPGAAYGGTIAGDIAAHAGVTLLAPLLDTLRSGLFGVEAQAL